MKKKINYGRRIRSHRIDGLVINIAVIPGIGPKPKRYPQACHAVMRNPSNGQEFSQCVACYQWPTKAEGFFSFSNAK